jgi:arsenate reductase
VLDVAQGARDDPGARHRTQYRGLCRQSPAPSEIKAVLKATGMTPRMLLRRNGTPYDELGLDDPSLSDEALIEAMSKHSILIERPVVTTEKGTRLCRPAERLDEIL